MIERIADAIEARLQGMGLFKAVEKTVTAKILKSPPSVAVFLAFDRMDTDKPTTTRLLVWDLLLTVSALGAKKGDDAGSYLDAIRDAFIGWRPWTTGGVLPAEVPEIRMEGIEQTMLVYTVRLTMKVMPAIIASQG